jgi:hypothetical protein
VKEWFRAYGLGVAAIAACVVGAFAAFMLAADAAAIRGMMRDDDVRYRALPEETRWSPRELVPGGAAALLLGVDDDVLFRRAVRATRLSHPETPGFSDPSYVVTERATAGSPT